MKKLLLLNLIAIEQILCENECLSMGLRCTILDNAESLYVYLELRDKFYSYNILLTMSSSHALVRSIRFAQTGC